MTPSIDRGVCVPKGTPAAKIKILENAFLSIARDPKIQQEMIEQGFVPATMGAREFKAYIEEKTKEYKEVLRDLEIK